MSGAPSGNAGGGTGGGGSGHVQQHGAVPTVEVHDPGLPPQQGNVLHAQAPDEQPPLSTAHASMPFLEAARLGHEDSLVATLTRSRHATRRLGLDRVLAGKARCIAAGERPFGTTAARSAGSCNMSRDGFGIGLHPGTG